MHRLIHGAETEMIAGQVPTVSGAADDQDSLLCLDAGCARDDLTPYPKQAGGRKVAAMVGYQGA